MTVLIEPVARHVNMIDAIAEWHRAEWGHEPPCDTVAFWADCLRRSAHVDRIPITFVALEEDEPLGSVTLVEHNMSTRIHWEPWLAALYVHPAQRGRGVASALVQHAMRSAQAMNIERLYLYTNTARGLYERLGWRVIEEDDYEGVRVAIMSVALG